MSNLVSERRDHRPLAAVFATIALAVVALLAVAPRAGAAETLFWGNYSGEPDAISFAGIDGAGGGLLNASPTGVTDPEGMAYDTVTNRLFAAVDVSGGQIVAINLDGSGAAPFTAPGAVFAGPEGVAVDPVARTIYWINTDGEGSIGWARLDGSAGGVLSTAGATLDNAFRLAVDPVGGRVYWGNNGGAVDGISFANVNNTGGGDLDLTGATLPKDITGVAVDPSGGRIYWIDNQGERISFASLAGGGGGDVNLSGATFDDPYGLAFDPSLGRLYWGNYGVGKVAAGAIGFADIAGGGGAITPLTAPAAGPQDPLVIKSPRGTGLPAVTRNSIARAELTCSQGTWAADFPGSFVYQAPRSFAYQWTRDGAPVPGATAATFTATAPGTYGCTVTATNHSGSAAQASATVPVKASKLKLTTKRKAKADPGDRVTFKLKIVNQGDLQSKKARICVKLPKAAKDDLRKPKCKKLAPLAGLAKRNAKIRIKVKPGADEGTGKLTFQVKGTPGKAAKSKIVVR